MYIHIRNLEILHWKTDLPSKNLLLCAHSFNTRIVQWIKKGIMNIFVEEFFWFTGYYFYIHFISSSRNLKNSSNMNQNYLVLYCQWHFVPFFPKCMLHQCKFHLEKKILKRKWDTWWKTLLDPLQRTICFFLKHLTFLKGFRWMKSNTLRLSSNQFTFLSRPLYFHWTLVLPVRLKIETVEENFRFALLLWKLPFIKR